MPFQATPFQAATEQEHYQLGAVRVLQALDDHALTEIVAAAADLSVLQTLRILQNLQERGLVKQFGKDCWSKR